MLGAPGVVVSSARGLKWTVQVDLRLPVASLCSRIGDGVSARIKIGSDVSCFNFHKLWRVESPGKCLQTTCFEEKEPHLTWVTLFNVILDVASLTWQRSTAKDIFGHFGS